MPQTNDFDRHLCVCVDAQGYSGRDAQGQRELQAELRTILDSAANAARLDRLPWKTQEQGDGELMLVPVGSDEPRVIDDMIRHIAAFLTQYNKLRRADAYLRLRVALHSGVAYPAPLGFAGPAVVVVTRLLQSDELRGALDSATAHLAAILSPTAYEVVETGHTTLHPSRFRKVTVRAKGYFGDAWIWIPSEAYTEPAPPAGSPTRGRDTARAPNDMYSRNDGVIISGEVVSRPIAVGDNARSIQYLSGSDRTPPAEARSARRGSHREGLPQVADGPEKARRGSGTDARVVPQQLPAAVAHFAGRTDQLATLTGLLRGRAEPGTVVISAIGGTAGVGKTALAVFWAHRVADRFPDGQLYMNLRGFDPGGQVMDPAEAVRRFLDVLGVPAERVPANPDAQFALYRSELAGRRVLVMLDNARDTTQVRALLPGAPGCLVVVTSRNQLSGLVAAEGAHPITLDLLTPGEARQLLARRLGPDRLAAEPEAVEQIITACARLPLAVVIVAARAATHPHLPLHTLAGELRDASARLDTLTTDDPHIDVRAVFSWSYHALTPDAARLFRHLGLHPGPDISAPVAASLAALPLPRVRLLLAELTRAHLLVEPTPGRYTCHDLLRAYAAEQAHTHDTDAQRHAATGRMLDHYLHTAYTADRLVHPTRDPITLTPPQPGVTPEHPADYEQALAWFAAEHAALLAAVDHAATTRFDTHTWQLAWTLTDFLVRRGHWHDWATTHHAALAAAQRLADPPVQARAHRLLGFAYTRLGRFDDAHTHLRHALDLHRQAGDQVGQAHTHYNLGVARERQGRHGEALDHAQQALDLYRATGHRHGQADALNTVGWCHALLGDHQQALTYCQQALTLHQELDDRLGQADTWNSLGYTHRHLGHHDQALACHQHALDLMRDLGYRYGEAFTLTNLGDTHHTADNPHAACHAWQQALTILNQLDHPDAGQVRTKLATLDTAQH